MPKFNSYSKMRTVTFSQFKNHIRQNIKVEKRWLIAIMGTLLQTCLGGVYAWSFFQRPIMAAYSWSNTEVAWIFSIAICFLGLAASWGGINLSKFGPRKLAVSGAALFAAGYILSAVAMNFGNLPLFYLSYGVLGGCGLGLGYVTPVATCAKWFPDRKGFVTGMVVMGFGLGALLMSKVFAPVLMLAAHDDLPTIFLSIGIIMAVLAPAAAWFLKNPPEDYRPDGWTAPQILTATHSFQDFLTVRDCLFSKQFMIMWLFFFANITAGMMFIGFQSPMLQDLLRTTEPYASLDSEAAKAALAGAGATLIGMSSLFNGLGRFFWGGLSDKIGRIVAFRLILGTQILVFLLLPYMHNPMLFSVSVCYVLLCYGGGFGTAPSAVFTVFGSRLMPVVYGTLLTAWSAGGIVGPQVVAFLKDSYGDQASNRIFGVGAATLAMGAAMAFLINDKPLAKKINGR